MEGLKINNKSKVIVQYEDGDYKFERSYRKRRIQIV